MRPNNPVTTAFGATLPATLILVFSVVVPVGKSVLVLWSAFMRDLAESFSQESPTDFSVQADGRVHYPHLALSGGGANGAFGAGFLNGWTASGKRPVFKIVTGVSTGALMAPYAFLGPDYDNAIREFYTNTSSRNVFQMLSIWFRMSPTIMVSRFPFRYDRSALYAIAASRALTNSFAL